MVLVFFICCVILVLAIWYFLSKYLKPPIMTIAVDTEVLFQHNYQTATIKRIELDCEAYCPVEELESKLQTALIPLQSRILVFNNEEPTKKPKDKEPLVLEQKFETGIVNYVLNNLQFPNGKSFKFRFFFDKEMKL